MAIIGKVHQKGIDLVIDVYRPTGELLKQIDGPNGINGIEAIDMTAKQSGKHQLVIHSLDKEAESGSYTLEVLQLLSLPENTKRITKKELPTETLYKL